MRFLRRSLAGVFLLALTAGLLAMAGGSVIRAVQDSLAEGEPARPARERVFAVNVLPYIPETVAPVLETFGEVESRRRLELRAAAAGDIVWLADRFVEGGRVQAGELLARIDPQDAESDLATARADLAEAEADARDAERGLALARDELLAAEEQAALRANALERQRDLVSRGVGTEAGVEDAELSAASSRQSALSRRQAVAQAETRLEQMDTLLERRAISLSLAERRLTDTEIFAPFDGILSEVSVVEGRLVSTNERMAEIIDPAALEVSFRISTARYSQLLGPDGQLPPLQLTASLDVLGADLTATGRIVREGGTIEAGQTGRLLFAQLDAAPGFRPGDFVTIRIDERPIDRVARLPAGALGSDGNLLIVGDNDRLEARQASLVRRQGDDILVRGQGLRDAWIVAERTPLLGEGVRVRPIMPELEGAQAAQPEAELVALEPERRARLVAFVEGNSNMPAEAKARILGQLQEDQVPIRVVERIESRMGG